MGNDCNDISGTLVSINVVVWLFFVCWVAPIVVKYAKVMWKLFEKSALDAYNDRMFPEAPPAFPPMGEQA